MKEKDLNVAVTKTIDFISRWKQSNFSVFINQ